MWSLLNVPLPHLLSALALLWTLSSSMKCVQCSTSNEGNKKISYKFTKRFIFFFIMNSCNGIMFGSSSGHWHDEHFYKSDYAEVMWQLTCVRRAKY
jgi:hypothetical protein